MSKNFGNKHAQKPDEVKASAYIQVRCTLTEQQNWKALAESQGLKLSELIRKLLNASLQQSG